MPGADWWDEEAEVNYVTPGPKVIGRYVLIEVEEAQALKWLVTQLRGHSLHIDGKQWWSLPHTVLSPYPTRTPLEAILVAYRKHKAVKGLRDGGDYSACPAAVPGAVSERGEVQQ